MSELEIPQPPGRYGWSDDYWHDPRSVQRLSPRPSLWRRVWGWVLNGFKR